MGKEIERKFLVANESWRDAVRDESRYEQGYLAVTDQCAVRVRIEGEKARLNIKNATLDIERQEYEYTVPVADAREMLTSLCAGRSLSKTRYRVEHGDNTWEVDVFEGANEGLVLAEIELESRDQTFTIPPWVGEEVSGNPRYLNSSLAMHPYRSWSRDRQ